MRTLARLVDLLAALVSPPRCAACDAAVPLLHAFCATCAATCLPASDARAWLAARLPRWLENRGRSLPSGVGQVQAEFVPGAVKLGVVARLSAGDYVIGMTLEPRVDDSGALWVTARTLSVGRVSLPLSWLDSGLASTGLGSDVIDALAGRRPLSAAASFELEDGRHVRLVGIEPRAGLLIATCTTGRAN